MTESREPDTGKEITQISASDGTAIAYERAGSGPSLVLVHGAMFARSVWDIGDLRSKLAKQTTVYAMDRRNHGDSGTSDDASPQAQFADVVAVAESIDDPVHLLGHSSGANYVLWAAPQIDNLQSLILHEPAAPPAGDLGDAMKETMAEVVEMIELGQSEQALELALAEWAQFAPDEVDALRSSPMWDAHVDSYPRTLLAELGRAGDIDWWDLSPFEDLSTPTLLIVGSERGHTELAERLHEMMPNSRLATMEGYGHAPHLVAPDRYTDEVLSFINEVD